MKPLPAAAVLLATMLSPAFAQGTSSGEYSQRAISSDEPARGAIVPRCMFTGDPRDCTPLTVSDAMGELADRLSLEYTGDASAARKMVAEKALHAACTIPSYRDRLGDMCKGK